MRLPRCHLCFKSLLIMLSWLLLIPLHSQADITEIATENQKATQPRTLSDELHTQLLEEMIWIEGGSFEMGSRLPTAGNREKPAHKVTLDGFYIGKTEVTQQLFEAIMGWNYSYFPCPNCPVNNLSWFNMLLFIERLNEATNKSFRLPTEAEWAWAARVDSQSTSQVFPWANELYPPMQISGNYADQSARGFLSFTLPNYNDQYPVSAVVGSFPANGKGLYDMSGNVAEWVNDYFDIRPNRSEPNLDPRGPEQGNKHVIRGASWALASRTELRLSYRDSGTDGRIDLGFRIARYVDKPGGAL